MKEALLVYLDVARKEISRTPGKRLAVVEKYLDQGRVMLNLSMTKMRRFVRELGVCLLDLRVHGEGIRGFLRKNPSFIVRKEKAKEFRHVKMCLVRL